MKIKIALLCGLAIILFGFAAVQLTKPASPMPNTAGSSISDTKTNTMSNTTKIPSLQFTTSISIGGHKLLVAVADTEQSRQQGLSGQTGLSEGHGLLFDFKNSPRAKPGFWMKDMLFPLDIIWIRDKVVVDISQDVPAPPPATALSDLPLYFPREPIDTVVEVPAGWCERHSVAVGDKLEY